MDSQVHGCGYTSATIVEGTFVTIVEQQLEVVFAVLTATLITPKKIMIVTEARIDHLSITFDSMVGCFLVSRVYKGP